MIDLNIQLLWLRALYTTAQEAVLMNGDYASYFSCALHREDWHPKMPNNFLRTKKYLCPTDVVATTNTFCATAIRQWKNASSLHAPPGS